MSVTMRKDAAAAFKAAASESESREDRRFGESGSKSQLPDQHGMFHGESGGDHDWGGAGATKPSVNERKPTL